MTSKTCGQLAVAFILFGLIGESSAQIECREVLLVPLKDELLQRYQYNANYHKSVKLCDLSNESECSNQNWNAGINVIIPTSPPVPLGLEGGAASGQCRSLYKMYCRQEHTQWTAAEAFASAKSLINETVALAAINAWRLCVNETPARDELNLIRVSGIPNDLQDFTLIIRVAGLPPGAQPPMISAVETGSTVLCGSDSLGAVVGKPLTAAGERLLCERKRTTAGSIIVRTTWGPAHVDFLAVASTPTRRPIATRPADTPTPRRSCSKTYRGTFGTDTDLDPLVCSGMKPGRKVRISTQGAVHFDGGNIWKWLVGLHLRYDAGDGLKDSQFDPNTGLTTPPPPVAFTHSVAVTVPESGTVKAWLYVRSCNKFVRNGPANVECQVVAGGSGVRLQIDSE